MQSLTKAPTASGNDGYWGIGSSPTAFNNNAAYIRFGVAGTQATDVLRAFVLFPSVTIPQEAAISSAVLSFVAQGDKTSGTINVSIKADDSDTATAPTTSGEGNGKTLTTALVDWQITAWVAGQTYTSPDISTVIQEVVDRAGWVSGNNLALYIVDDTSDNGAYASATSYDGSATNCASLSVTYTAMKGSSMKNTLKLKIRV